MEERLARPAPSPDAEATKPLNEIAQRAAALVERLTAGLDDLAPADRTPTQQATWLLAQLLGWHRREEKAFWWRYFDLCSRQDDELVDEREPLGNVSLVEAGTPNRLGTREQVYAFPQQDHGLHPGDTVHDPATKSFAGEVLAIDEVARTIRLKRTESAMKCGTPTSLIPYERFSTEGQELRLLAIGEHVADHGIDGEGLYRAARDLLLRRPPRIVGVPPGAPLRRPDESALAAGRRLVMGLDESMLPIQGPPGTGKTWTGARMILDLVAAGRKVGVTANSHKVIGNVLDAVVEAAAEAAADAAVERPMTVRLGQKPANGEAPTCAVARALDTNAEVASALALDEVDVVGGTAWLWSSTRLVDSVDVLVIDEAGQVSLANTIAVAPAARSMVLHRRPAAARPAAQGLAPARRGAECPRPPAR